MEAKLEAAEAAFWAALEDSDAPELLELGWARLAEAEQMPGATLPAVAVRIRQLREDLAGQQDMAHDTLRANFPAYRLLRDGLVHEVLVDEPWVVATTNSASGLAELLRSGWSRQAQYDVRVTAHMRHGGEELLPRARERWDLANEAYYVMAQNPRVWLDARRGRAANPGASSVRLRLDADFGDEGSMAPLWRVTGKATVREAGQATGQEVRAFGFALDRRDSLIQLVLLFGLGVGLAVMGSLRRRQWREVVAAVGALMVGALAVVGGLVLMRDWLPSPAGLTVTGLWAMLAIAALASFGPVILVVILPDRFAQVLSGLKQHWGDATVGRLPAQIGGSLPVLGAVLLASGCPDAVLACVGWWLALRGAHLLETARPKNPMLTPCLLTLTVLGAVTFVLVDCVAGDSSSARLIWGAIGLVASLLCLRRSIALLALVPLTVVAALSAVPWLAVAIGLVGFALGEVESRFGVAAVRSSALGPAQARGRLTLKERLAWLREEQAPCEPTRLRLKLGGEGDGEQEAIDERDDAKKPWLRYDVVEVKREYWRSVARALAVELEAEVVDLDPGAGSTDPLMKLRSYVGSSQRGVLDRMEQGARLVSGGEEAGAGEEDLHRLGRALADKVGQARTPVVLLAPDPLSRELEDVLNKAETRICTGRVSGGVRVRLVGWGGEGSRKDAQLKADFGADPARSFLEQEVGLESGLAAELATKLQDCRPVQVVKALERLVDRGLLPGGSRQQPVTVEEGKRAGVVKELGEAITDSGLPRVLPQDLDADVVWLLQVAAHVGVTFDYRLLCDALGMDAGRVARALCAAGSVVEDSDADGEFEFCQSETRDALAAAGRVPGAQPQRLRQSILDGLRLVMSTYADRAAKARLGSADDLTHALLLASVVLKGGGNLASVSEVMAPAVMEIRKHEGALQEKASILQGCLQDLLEWRGWEPRVGRELTRALLGFEAAGPMTNQALPFTHALQALRQLDGAGEDRDADLLRLEIARRCVANTRWDGAAKDAWHALEDSGVSRVELVRRMLRQLMESGGAEPLLVARARFQLASLNYVQIRGVSHAGRLDDSLRAVKELEASVAALREVRAPRDLLPALIELGWAQNTYAEVWLETFSAPHSGEPEGDLDAWRDLMSSRECVLTEARGIADAIESPQRRPLYTLEGWWHLQWGRMRQRLAGEHAKEDLRAARRCYEDNLEASRAADDRQGMFLMPSYLVPVCFKLGELEDARTYCDEYENVLRQLQGESAVAKNAFLKVHRFALACAFGGSGSPEKAKAGLEDSRVQDMRGTLAYCYAPHLDDLLPPGTAR